MRTSTESVDVIAQIHAAPQRLVLAFAGVGSLGLAWLHAVPGSSRTILEAIDCYAPRSLAEVVGEPPVQAVSAATAEAMAAWALRRAAALAEGDWPLLGVGLTGAIRTDRERRGADRAFVAVRSVGGVHVHPVTLDKTLSRQAQEELVGRLLIQAIAEECLP
jgi:nicotinamide mononucleotide (NMN) deamidase PncC